MCVRAGLCPGARARAAPESAGRGLVHWGTRAARGGGAGAGRGGGGLSASRIWPSPAGGGGKAENIKARGGAPGSERGGAAGVRAAG